MRALAPAALDALERLIREEERSRDNGGPVDADRDQALLQLRALHAALGELIRLARSEKPLAAALERIRTLRQEAKVTVGRVAAAAPVTGSVLLAFGTVAGIADFFVGSTVMSVAAGTLAGTTVKDALLKSRGTDD
ncbi:hypothetical protein [Sphingomonas natans]|uniref:hypothetical protein n=1 Tax=Sphingomonas natans TaxID=3063330 RepID=UPI0026E46D4D|nr:hypothetical protein [Sphingomonas sp. BIUV-7]